MDKSPHSEEDQGRTLCVLCCISFSNHNFMTRVDPAEDGFVQHRLTNFCDILLHTSSLQDVIGQETLQETVLKNTINSFIATHPEHSKEGLSVCSSCYGAVTSAVLARAQANMIENTVKTLKLQLLEQIRCLEAHMEVFYTEMGRIERTVKNSEESYLRHHFSREEDKHGVFLMRARILDVIPSFRTSQSAQYGRLNLEEEEIIIKDVASFGDSAIPSSSSSSAANQINISDNGCALVKSEVEDNYSNYFYEGDDDDNPPPMELSGYTYSPMALPVEGYSDSSNQFNGSSSYTYSESNGKANVSALKRGRGRPRKYPPTPKDAPRRGRGRPRTKHLPLTTPKLNQLRKVTAYSMERLRPLRKPGRPRIRPIHDGHNPDAATTVEMKDVKIKRPRGRPRKLTRLTTENVCTDFITPDIQIKIDSEVEHGQGTQAQCIIPGAKRPRGRPRKIPRYENLNRELMEVAVDPSQIISVDQFGPIIHDLSTEASVRSNQSSGVGSPWESDNSSSNEKAVNGIVMDGRMERHERIESTDSEENDHGDKENVLETEATLNFFQVLGLTRTEGTGSVLHFRPPSSTSSSSEEEIAVEGNQVEDFLLEV